MSKRKKHFPGPPPLAIRLGPELTAAAALRTGTSTIRTVLKRDLHRYYQLLEVERKNLADCFTEEEIESLAESLRKKPCGDYQGLLGRSGALPKELSTKLFRLSPLTVTCLVDLLERALTAENGSRSEPEVKNG